MPRDIAGRMIDDPDLLAAADAPIIPITFGPRSASLLLLGAKGWLVGYSVREASAGASLLATVNAVAQPAAGADWTFALPAAAAVLAIRGVLTTSAAVATRQPIVQVADAAGHVAVSSGGNQQLASTTGTYGWAGASSTGSSGVNDLFLGIGSPIGYGAGAVVSMATTNLQVGDQWSAITVTTSPLGSGAVCDLIDGGDANGAVLAALGLGAGLSTDQSFGAPGIPFDSGLFLSLVSGTVRGAVYVRLAA